MCVFFFWRDRIPDDGKQQGMYIKKEYIAFSVSSYSLLRRLRGRWGRRLFFAKAPGLNVIPSPRADESIEKQKRPTARARVTVRIPENVVYSYRVRYGAGRFAETRKRPDDIRLLSECVDFLPDEPKDTPP